MAPVCELGAGEHCPEVTETGTMGGTSEGDPLAAMMETLNGLSEEDMDTVSFLRQGALTNADERRPFAATANATKNAQLKTARREDPSATSFRETIRQRRLQRRLDRRTNWERSWRKAAHDMLALNATSEGNEALKEALGNNTHDVGNLTGASTPPTPSGTLNPASPTPVNPESNGQAANPQVKAVWKDQATLDLDHTARPRCQSSRGDELASERTSQGPPTTNTITRGGRAAGQVRPCPGGGYRCSTRGAVLGPRHNPRLQRDQHGHIG